MKILCIGEALIDMICTDKNTPLANGEHFLRKAGGAPTNVAAAIAALGGDVTLAAKVGADPFGQHLIDVMNSFKVNTEYLLVDDTTFTTFAFVSLLEDGQRDFVFNRGADGQLSVEDMKEIPLTNFSLVHFGSATAFLPGPLQKAYVRLLQEARMARLFVSFDPNYRQLLFGDQQESFIEQSWAFIQLCHFFKVSEEEAKLLTGQPDIEGAVAVFTQRSSATFCITLGSKGTLLVYGGRQEVVPSIPVKAIDSTGAGDAFVGAMLFQLRTYGLKEISSLTFADWKQAVANANRAGARTCEFLGAMEAFRQLSNAIFN